MEERETDVTTDTSNFLSEWDDLVRQEAERLYKANTSFWVWSDE